MSPPSILPRTLPRWSLLLLLGSGACSEEGSAPAAAPPGDPPLAAAPQEDAGARFSRLIAWRQPEVSIPPVATVAEHAVDHEARKRWRVLAGDHRYMPLPPHPDPFLVMQGDGYRTVWIPVHQETGSFNRVIVDAVCGEGNVRLLFRDQKAAFHRTPWRNVRGPPERHSLEFLVPEASDSGEFLRDVGVQFDTKLAVTGFQSLELRLDPRVTFLADTSAGPQFISILHSGRPAVRLTSMAPLRATFDAPAHAFLTFDVATVPGMLAPEEVATLVVRQHKGDREQTQRIPLRAPAGPTPWQAVRVALTAAEPARLDIEVELSRAAEVGPDVACAVSGARLFVPEPEPPTVLFITSDTHRSDHLGAAQAGVSIQTPVLDDLAGRGVLFENCYSTTNVTLPSHVSLMTGHHPRQTRVISNDHRLTGAPETLAERFQAAGYRTLAVVSAAHIYGSLPGLDQGFDRMAGPATADRPASESIDILDEWMHDLEDQALFVWLHLFDAHGPYQPPEPFAHEYYPAERDAFDPQLPDLGLDDVLAHHLKGLRDLDYPPAQYRGEISYLDDQLRRVLDRPRVRAGIVALTADHGECLGDHELYFTHERVFPDTLHVPLLLTFPGAPAGRRVREPVSHLDLTPTILSLAGLDATDLPGRQLLAPQPPSMRRFALEARQLSASLNHEGWHCILYLATFKGNSARVGYERHQLQLFHTDADPRCQHDQVELDPDRARRMRAEIIAWLNTEDSLGWGQSASLGDEEMAQLAELGYVDGSENLEVESSFDEACDCAHCRRWQP